MDQIALDGTLWVEEGRPYMIYCHEWVQVIDGAMVLVELAADLSIPAGNPLTLFHASAVGWSTGSSHDNIPVKSYVTDGYFLYRTKTGKLLMIWSSFMNGEYAIPTHREARNVPGYSNCKIPEKPCNCFWN